MKLKIEVKLTASKAFLQVLTALAGSAALAKPEDNYPEELKEISPILTTKVSQGIEAFPEELAEQIKPQVEQKPVETPTRKRRTKAEIEAEKAAAAAMQEEAESAEETTEAEDVDFSEVENTEESQSSDAEYTVEDIRAKVIAISNSQPHLKPKLKALLGEYGVERFTEINPKDFNEVMAKINKLS